MRTIVTGLILLISLAHAGAQTCQIISSDIVCKEELMSFDVSSSTTITSVMWDMGDATTSSQKAFNHKYSVAGVKNIKVILNLSGGGTCTASKQVTVYELPQFKIKNKADNIYCLSQNRVCFIDSSTGGDVGINVKKRIILWDDGDQSTTPNPVIGKEICHSYTNTGTFKVTIELTNDKDCKVKKEIDVKILPDVIPQFKVDITKGCDSVLVIFEDVTSKDTNQILNRIYDWGDGSKSTTVGRKVGHYYKKAGFYQLGLTLVQKNGCRTRRDTLIDIFIPEIKFNIVKDAYRKCVGNSYRIEQKDLLFGAGYSWIIAGKKYEGKVVEPAPDLGKGYIQLTITYAGCSKTFKYDSIETVGIIPDVKALNVNQCMNKDTVFFCETDRRYGTKRVTFFWDFGDNLAPQCTTSIKNGVNTKGNCNFSTDSIGKHFYKNEICRNWKLSIKDLDYGCHKEEVGIVNLVKPDTFSFNFSADRLCLGLKPDYAIQFSKTLCPIIEVKVNLDSACGKNNFTAFVPSHRYQTTCNKDGYVTVGFAIKYGNRKVYRDYCDTTDYFIDPKRECHDTIWFHNWYRLLEEPFPPFSVYGRCIPSTVKPILLDSFQSNIKFSKWNWGDQTKTDTVWSANNDSIIHSPTHIYKKAGAYNVNFHLENINRCYGTYNQLLILGYSMNMRFDTVICPGIEVMFKDSIFYQYSNISYWHDARRKALGKESFKWDFDDGRGFVTDTINPVVTFPAKGIYKIRLAAKDSSNCFDTLTKNIKVGGVYAGIKAINKKIVCDDIIQFFDSSYSDFKPPADSIVKHFWSFGDFRNPSYLKDPFHFYKNFGEFTIFHKVENTRGCTDSANIKIKIDGPEPNFVIVSDTVGCVPFTAEFKNTSVKTKDYIWYFGDPLKTKLSTNRDTNVRFTYTKPGVYYIYLFGSDSVVNPNTGNTIYYCSSTFPDSAALNRVIRRIVVLPIPKVDFKVNPVLCKNKPFEVSDLSDPIYKRYKWVLQGMDSVETAEKKAHLTSKDTGKYLILFTPTYTPTGPYQRMCYDTISKWVSVSAIKAELDFVKDDFCPVYTFTNKTHDFKNLKWDLGHMASGEENNIRYEEVVTHNYVPDTGIFYPCLFVENNYGCRDTICKELKVSFTIKAIFTNVFTPGNKDDKNDAFDILLDNVEKYDLRIYNRWGLLVYESQMDGIRNDGNNWTGQTKAGVDCPEGTYFYIFDYKFKCEERKRRGHGTITLIRKED